MRILALTNLYPSPLQPHRAPFNRQQLCRLAARHPLAIIAPIHWTDERAARRKGRSRLPADRRVVLDGITIEHPCYYYTPKVFRDWYGTFFLWSIRAAFQRALNDFRPDLIYATWAYPDGWAGVELGRRAGLPVIVKIHGSDILTLTQFPARLKQTTNALRRADGVVTVSQDLADRVVALGANPSRVRVVINGVDGDRFHPGSRLDARRRLGLDPAAPLLLAIGNLEPIKGFDVLIQACDRLARDGARFVCNLIGQGSQRAALKRQIAAADCADRVHLLGAKSHDELPDWYRAADLVVLPSRSEGVPNVLLEAGACGVPFVASAVGGIPEIAPAETSRLVPPNDPDRLAAAITEMLAAPPRTRPNGPGRTHEDAVTELIDCFERVLTVPRPILIS